MDYERISSLLRQKRGFSKITLRDEIKAGEKIVKFGAVIGNPPYQKGISEEKLNSSLSKQLFPYYTILSMEITTNISSLIIPARWFAGDAQDKSFLKLREFSKLKIRFLIYTILKIRIVFLIMLKLKVVYASSYLP